VIALVLSTACGRDRDGRSAEPRRSRPATAEGDTGQAADRGPTRGLAIRVLADSGRSFPLSAPPPRVIARLASVVPAAGGAPSPPLPPAAPDTVPPGAAAASQSASPRLLAPILKRPATLVPPVGMNRAAAIELDVRVDVLGRVVDVRWADGDRDTALVRSAERCAESMEFYPAQLAGRPVEVWCRQRFEFAPH
jgi:hypothetical protein